MPYTNTPNSKFPELIDYILRMSDLEIGDLPLVAEYYKLYNSGNLNAAKAYLQSHSELDKKLFNADKYNRLRDAVVSTQQYLHETPYIKSILRDGSDITISLLGDTTQRLYSIHTDYINLGNVMMGDIYPLNSDGTSGDGVVDENDLTLLNDFLTNAANLTPEQKIKADVDGDGVITVADKARLDMYINGSGYTLADPILPEPKLISGYYNEDLNKTDYVISGWVLAPLVYITAQSEYSGEIDMTKVKRVLNKVELLVI